MQELAATHAHAQVTRTKRLLCVRSPLLDPDTHSSRDLRATAARLLLDASAPLPPPFAGHARARRPEAHRIARRHLTQESTHKPGVRVRVRV